MVGDDPDGELSDNFSWDNCLTTSPGESSFNSINAETWISPPETKDLMCHNIMKIQSVVNVNFRG